MKFNWRKYTYWITIIVLVVSSLSVTISTIYYFSRQEFAHQSTTNPLSPPIFSQEEVNQLTTSSGIKVDLFKTMIAKKTPATIHHYYVDQANSSWKLNIAYSWENQSGNWIYELKYH